jgi:parallel beta-helix repeat protein
MNPSRNLIRCVMAGAVLISATGGVVTTEQGHKADNLAGSAPTWHVRCDDGGHHRRGSLQRAIDAARPGKTILVSGTCHENVTIPLGKDGLTLDGGGTAGITPPDATLAAVLVRAKDVTVRGFTVTGGFGGVVVTQGGRAHVDGNTIRDSGAYGVIVSQLSSAVIVNNTIDNSFQAGIGVAETSYAFIGFVLPSDTVASPNVITRSRAQGVVVFRGSYARIVGNDISSNGANGVNVRESSSAQISDNTINANGQNGILVAQGSGVLLGTDSGNTIFTRPNVTTANNLGFGIRCQIAAHADGRLGTLNGVSGPEHYIEGCVPSLIR